MLGLRHFATLLFILFIGLNQGIAGAQDEARLTVRLTVDECADLDHGDLERLFDIEIQTNGAELVASNEGGVGPVTQASIRCIAEGPLRLEVRDPITDKIVIRDLALSSVEPEMQTRTVALSLAELVIVSWSEVVVNPDPVIPRPTAAPEALSVAAANAASRGLGLGSPDRGLVGLAVAEVLFFLGNESTTGVSGGAAIEVAISESWMAYVELGIADHLTVDAGLGEIATRSYGLAFFIHRALGSGAVGGRIGVGLRGGFATMDGTAATPSAIGDTHTGIWLGPALRGCATLRLGSRQRGRAGVCGTAGWGLVSTVGVVNGEDRIRVGGPFIGVGLEVGGGR